MTETTQDSWKHKVPSMLLAQVTAYVLLVAATVIPTPGATPIIPMIVVALVLAAFIALMAVPRHDARSCHDRGIRRHIVGFSSLCLSPPEESHLSTSPLMARYQAGTRGLLLSACCS